MTDGRDYSNLGSGWFAGKPLPKPEHQMFSAQQVFDLYQEAKAELMHNTLWDRHTQQFVKLP